MHLTYMTNKGRSVAAGVLVVKGAPRDRDRLIGRTGTEIHW